MQFMEMKLEFTKKNAIIFVIILAFLALVGILGKAPAYVTVITVIFGFIIAFSNMKSGSEITNSLIAYLVLIISAVIGVCMTQYIILDPENFGRAKKSILCTNVILLLAAYLVLFAITNHLALTCTLIHGVVLLFAFADYFVYSFRQNEIVFSDVKAIGTGLSVSSEYELHLHSRGTLVLMISVIWIAFVWKLHNRIRSWWKLRVVSAFCVLLCTVTIASNTVSLNTETWEQKGTYKNGFFLNFMLSIRDSFVSAPEGYSLAEIEKLEAEYRNKAANMASDSEGTDVVRPNIIVIMNESYADLTVIGDFKTNRNATKFYDSLKEESISGYALSSVFGAKTPNSEWEYLTGNSMAFLPSGSVAYQQYMQENPSNLVQTMKENDYTCVAFHPYYATGWSRNTVYPKLGFDEMHFLDDFPQEQMLRDYVTDQELYEQIIKRFEEKNEDETLFMMNVTMQNHGGYVTDYEKFEEKVHKTGQSYTDANQYLSLVYESDQALEYLISYFRECDEPVEIVFFGDHQPSLSEGFYKILNGKGLKNLTSEEVENLYTVPFFVWTNYESETEEASVSSLNMLSLYTMEAANMELTPYELFLKDFQEVIPAINSRGYYSKADECYKTLSEAIGEEAEWIRKYKMLQYNSLFDKKNRSEYFFPSSK